MKKIKFTLNSQFGFWKSFLKQFLLGISLSLFSIVIIFLGLEQYFKFYYQQNSKTTSLAMNLPIYQESTYRSWDHFPGAEVEHGYGSPPPKIKINSLGLRSPELSEEKNKNRFLLLGDSFTFGMGVREKDTFANRLQKSFGTKFHEVINAGVIGQSIDDAFMYLKHEGIKLQPDFVVFNFFVGNDVTELRRHSWTTNKTGELLAVKDDVLHVDKNHKLRNRVKKEPISYFIFWLNNKIKILKQKYSPNKKFDPSLTWPIFLANDHKLQDPKINDYWHKFEIVLKQMQKFCKKNNITFLVAVIPMDVQVSRDYWKKYPGTPFDEEAFLMKRPQEHIKILGTKHNIPIFDALPALQYEELEYGPFYFEKDTHFNRKGHRFFAAYLWRFLMDNYF